MVLNAERRKACFEHARNHVLEALREMASDEHHSIISFDGKGDSGNNDGHDCVMAYIEAFITRAEKVGMDSLTADIVAEHANLRNMRNTLQAGLGVDSFNKDVHEEALEEIDRRISALDPIAGGA